MSKTTIWILVGTAVLLLIILGVFLYKRNEKLKAAAEQSGGTQTYSAWDLINAEALKEWLKTKTQS